MAFSDFKTIPEVLEKFRFGTIDAVLRAAIGAVPTAQFAKSV